MGWLSLLAFLGSLLLVTLPRVVPDDDASLSRTTAGSGAVMPRGRRRRSPAHPFMEQMR
jgi:hypothetical protein